MSRIIRSILLFISFLFVSLLYLQGEELSFVTDIYPPFVIEENGTITGRDTEVIREICEYLQIKSTIEIVPWARAVRSIQLGNFQGIFTPSKNPERERFMVFSSEYMNKVHDIVVTLDENDIEINDLSEIGGETVLVVRGHYLIDELKEKQIAVYEVKDHIQLLNMLIQKRFKYGAGGEIPIKMTMKELGHRGIINNIYTINTRRNFIGFSRAALGDEGAERMAERFGLALKALRDEGVIDSIEDTYW